MLDDETFEAPAGSGGEDTNISKQAACHQCRKSKVKCVKPLAAEACQKCASAGIQCVVPKYHVGRYKGVKNKRSGLEKAIHQVEEAVKKARMNGSDLDEEHSLALQKVLDESKATVSQEKGNKTQSSIHNHNVQIVGEAPRRTKSTQDLDIDGDVTVNNANNPLQLLAIASAIPESMTTTPCPTVGKGDSPNTETELTTDNDETLNFFSPMTSKLDVATHLCPLELGLVSHEEALRLFEYFHDNLAHTRWGLDRTIHSVQFVKSRSAYLFTSILACSALFLHDTASLSIRLHNHSKWLARKMVSDGYRSLEIVLAYMINVPWMQPGKTWATDDETCYYLSTALTIAIDLSLNKIVIPSSTMRSQGVMDRISPADCIESQRALNMDGHTEIDFSSVLGRRLLRARERTWLALFTLDRGVCLARGRTWTVPTGPLVETCDTWHVSDISDPWDGSLIATAVLRRDFGNLVANVRAACDHQHLTVDGGNNAVKVMREKVEGFFSQWYQTWTYQIQQRDGCLPPYVEILVSHGKLSAYCNVINHPTASIEVKQFFRAAGLTAALHVIKTAVQNESKLHSMPNNSVIMVSFAACFVLGLSTARRNDQIYIADHVKTSIGEAADVLERIGSCPVHRRGASTLFGRHIKRIMKPYAAPAGTIHTLAQNDQSNFDMPPMNVNNNFAILPYTLHSASEVAPNFFPGFDSMTDDQLLEMIQNSKNDIDTLNSALPNEDSLFMDWLDWPNLT